jgi:hypothetical protein
MECKIKAEKYYSKSGCGIIVCPMHIEVIDGIIGMLIQYYSSTGRYMGYEPVIIPIERTDDWIEYATLEEARYG